MLFISTDTACPADTAEAGHSSCATDNTVYHPCPQALSLAPIKRTSLHILFALLTKPSNTALTSPQEQLADTMSHALQPAILVGMAPITL